MTSNKSPAIPTWPGEVFLGTDATVVTIYLTGLVAFQRLPLSK